MNAYSTCGTHAEYALALNRSEKRSTRKATSIDGVSADTFH